jgi:hypothetical protein
MEDAPKGADEANPQTEEQTFSVDGVEYSAEDIREMSEGNMRHADYTKKTMELASDRRAFEAQRSETPVPTATPPETWQEERADTYVDPDVAKLSQSVESLVELEKDRQARDEKAAEDLRVADANKAIDTVVDHADKIIGETYGLATLSGIASAIQNYIYEKNVVPTVQEVETMVRGQHNEIARRGGTVRKLAGEIPPEDSTKEPLPSSEAAPEVAPERPNINDSDEVERRLAAHIEAHKDDPGFLTE